MEYSLDLYDEQSISRMLRHWKTVLREVCQRPEQAIGDVRLLSESERHQLAVEFNDTQQADESGELVHEMIERQARLRPDAIAVISGQERMSYRELDERTNQLAHHLRRKGAGAERVVGICMDRSPEMVVAMVGVMKSSAAYVPLDPGYPKQRLRMMIEDAGMGLIVSKQGLVEAMPEHKAEMIRIDADWEEISECDRGAVSREGSEENLSHVIYTSGSTGEPKGVGIRQGATAALIRWAREVYSEEQMRGVMASTSMNFDLSVFEVMAPLSVGGTVVVAESALEAGRVGAGGEVSLINTVPSAMGELVRMSAVPESVKVVNLAGEALKRELVEEVYERSGVEEVMNLYGPTEDTTYTSWERVRRGEGREVTIGRPVSNTRIYILDERMEMVPIGVRGELYTSGEGLARGYYKRGEMTAERFVADVESDSEGGRMYRTGDVCRYREDGRIEYIGRKDEQVKVRGYRIELREIEGEMERQEEVREAVVVVQERGGVKRLVGYVVGEGGEVDVEKLKRKMRERVPEYMVPSVIVKLEEMPLTANGKVDRKRLPEPEQQQERGSDREREKTAVEEIVAGIWSEVLKVKSVGVEESFFEMGGHSLLATQVISKVREALGVEVGLREMFEHPTVASLAEAVERERGAGELRPVAAMRRASREGGLPLSYAQQRLWFIHQLEPESAAYNMPQTLRVKGALNVSAFGRSLSEIVRRHEVLRTRFEVRDGQPVQVIEEVGEVELPVWDLRGLAEEEREKCAREIGRQEAARPFDLERGPVWRASLAQLGAEEHVLMMSMHHVASDGWSMGVMQREFKQIYEAMRDGRPSQLEELAIQYVDFAVWQREYLQGEVLEEQLRYWRHALSDLPVLELQTDWPRPTVATHLAASEHLTLSESLSQQLKELSRREAVTLFMTLLAAFQVLLARYSGQLDIAVGTPIAGRDRPDTDRLIGFFLNTLTLRTILSPDLSFTALLKRVREIAIGAYSHQDVPFERLIEEIEPERSLSRSPIFQVFFNMPNMDSSFSLPGLDLEVFSHSESQSKFDISLYAADDHHHIRIALICNRDLYEQHSVTRMLTHLRNLLKPRPPTLIALFRS